MTRVKRGILKTKKRKALKQLTKGYKWSRKSKRRMMQEAVRHAGRAAYRGRKERKRTFRRLWQVRINAAARKEGLTYSEFMNKLKQKNVTLNRKSLAELAATAPAAFSKLVAEVKK